MGFNCQVCGEPLTYFEIKEIIWKYDINPDGTIYNKKEWDTTRREGWAECTNPTCKCKMEGTDIVYTRPTGDDSIRLLNDEGTD